MLYKILFSSYSDYNVFNTTNFEKVVLNNFTPRHLFTNDVFSFENDVITVVHSSMRAESISGVLCLRDNKTYGRTKGGGEGRLLYKFIPDDKRIIPFVVPYDLKKVGFSKVFVNNYVVIQYKEWSGTHPQGIITVNIGPVNVLDNFYEYQLYCKSLNASIQKFKKDTTNSLKDTTHEGVIKSIAQKYEVLENRCDWKVFTIDPLNTSDFDDGFSIVDGPRTILLSVYITNVTLSMDFLNLWDSFSQRISTIYLPNKKRPMLPTVLSECLCSLISGQIRTAFTMDILIDASLYEIVEITYKNTLVKVHKNYVYEEYSLLETREYQHLLDVTQHLSKTYKYMNNVRNSHDVVTYLMILMNYHSAKRMITFNNGIFRTAAFTKLRNADVSINANTPEEILQFVKVWSSSSCQYVDVSKIDGVKNTNHDLLDMDAYIHMTSPIRRLVDLLNMMLFQKNTGMAVFSENADRFLDKWMGEIDYINSTMKTIRKLQNNCVLMDLCVNNPETMEKHYEGYLFDKIFRNDGIFQYMVYIPELKMTSRINSTNEYEYCEKRLFAMFLFSDEDSLKKKIRLQIIV